MVRGVTIAQQRALQISGRSLSRSVQPDSGLVHDHDATTLSLSDQDSISSWDDESSNGNDLSASGSPTYVKSDGVAWIETDGIEDYLDGPTDLGERQPNTIFIVFAYQSLSDGSENDMIIDRPGPEVGRHGIWTSDNSVEFSINAGSKVTVGGSPDTEVHLFELETGSTDSLRIDGVKIGSGDAGDADWGGLRIGAQDEFQNYTHGRYGRILGYNRELSSYEKQNVRQTLEREWPFTLS